MLKDQNVLITGGTAGIGKAIALHFAAHGARVAIFGTNKERGEEVLREIEEKTGSKSLFVSVDVANTQEVQKAVDEVLKEMQTIDVLINNAGIVRDNLLLRMSEEDWDRVLNVNLKSVYNLCKAVIRPMMKARKGKIINVSSVIGLTGNAGQVNYAASKSGIIGVTKSLAKELASRNIYVNCIAPGFIETSMTSDINETHKEEIMRNIPLKRIGRPEEIASVALFLASDGANYITGQVLPVDGGMTM
jgi:3-oxoacyl-[acyl-carrier protein] reductase